MSRLTPRERWFWLGVGFASAFFVLFAFTVILLGLVLSRVTPAGETARSLLSVPQSARDMGPHPQVSVPSPNVGSEASREPRTVLKVPSRPVPLATGRLVPALHRSAHRPRQGRRRSPVTACIPLASSQPQKPPSRPWNRNRLALRWSSLHSVPVSAAGRSPASPRLVAAEKPYYPTSAMVEGVTGSVRVHVAVDPRGVVRRAAVARSSGDLRLDAAAVRAAMGWRYRPARRAGRPVASVDQAQFDFYRAGGDSKAWPASPRRF